MIRILQTYCEICFMNHPESEKSYSVWEMSTLKISTQSKKPVGYSS